MHDLRRQRALARIAKIRAAERDAAHQELLLAGERERDAEVTSHRADEATFAAAADWQNELATGGFSPELAGALAFALNQRVDLARQAKVDFTAMTDARQASETAWQLGNARCRQADDAVAASKRAIARDREEHALESLADRVSFDWTRR